MYLVYVLGKAEKIFHNTMLYNKGTNLNNLENVAGSKDNNAGKIYKVKHWDLPPIGWLKWKLMHPELEQDVQLWLAMHNAGQIQFAWKDVSWLSSFFVMKTLFIREAV